MRGPWRLTTLWVFTACHRDSFTFLLFLSAYATGMHSRSPHRSWRCRRRISPKRSFYLNREKADRSRTFCRMLSSRKLQMLNIILSCNYLYPCKICESTVFDYLKILRHVFEIYNPKLNSVALVRKRTIPTEWSPLVGEVSANFCWQRVPRDQRNGFPRPLISIF
jgi:hypothetical protein